ncbi:MAG: DUF2330 domain-containing protein [Candidatus Bathyarchaeia archaeon]
MSRLTVTRITILFLIFSLTLIPLAQADRGVLPLSDVDVYGPGQRAIIAWNGETERLILSTDLYADADSRILEVLPLPSKPRVEKGAVESFEEVQRLMMRNLPKTLAPERGLEKELIVIFHERIGAHDITVVEATSLEELVKFISRLAAQAGASNTPEIREKTRLILEDYLDRGLHYWVFDLVDLTPNPNSLDPIAYEFQTPSLYFPLKISSTAKGPTKIVLYLITPSEILDEELPAAMSVARYLPNDQPIRFQVSHEDLSMIDKGVASLFSPVPLIYPPPPAAWFTAVKYEGEVSDLDFDLEIPPRPERCRLIEVNVNKPWCNVGEDVEISVKYTHLLSGCYEVQVLHHHQIRLEIFNSKGSQIQSWQWSTEKDLYQTVSWKPSEAGEFLVKASSWWNGETLEVEDQTKITAHKTTTYIPPTPYVESNYRLRWLIYGVLIAVACMLIGVGVAYWMLKPRLKQGPQTSKRSKHT